MNQQLWSNHSWVLFSKLLSELMTWWQTWLSLNRSSLKRFAHLNRILLIPQLSVILPGKHENAKSITSGRFFRANNDLPDELLLWTQQFLGEAWFWLCLHSCAYSRLYTLKLWLVYRLYTPKLWRWLWVMQRSAQHQMDSSSWHLWWQFLMPQCNNFIDNVHRWFGQAPAYHWPDPMALKHNTKIHAA